MQKGMRVERQSTTAVIVFDSNSLSWPACARHRPRVSALRAGNARIPHSVGTLAVHQYAHDLEARVGIEPTHKGFAVLVIESKLLTNLGISVGRCALLIRP
jgi:hypothetical protein